VTSSCCLVHSTVVAQSPGSQGARPQQQPCHPHCPAQAAQCLYSTLQRLIPPRTSADNQPTGPQSHNAGLVQQAEMLLRAQGNTLLQHAELSSNGTEQHDIDHQAAAAVAKKSRLLPPPLPSTIRKYSTSTDGITQRWASGLESCLAAAQHR
jgi:hypothetical protein